MASTGSRMPHTNIHRVACTNMRCMRVLPSAHSKKNQKIVVGDQNGDIICFKYNTPKNDIEIMFHQSKQETITSLTLYNDNIFVAFGQSIQGIKKKGKGFYNFKQTLNQDVTSLQVKINDGSNEFGSNKNKRKDGGSDDVTTNSSNQSVTLWCAGEFVYNCYINDSDTHFYMSNDIINDLIIIDKFTGKYFDEPLVMIACKDKVVRVLDKSNLLFEAETDAPVTCLCEVVHNTANNNLINSGSNDSELKCEIIFGLENGTIGQLFLTKDNIEGGWVLDDETNNEGCVNCLTCYDFTDDDYCEVIVGRDNGMLDVFKWNVNGKPYILYSESINESITSVDTGYVTGITDQDIIISTYSGKIIAFHCDPTKHFTAWNKSEFETEFRFQKQNTSMTNLMNHTSLNIKKSEYSNMKNNLISEISELEREFLNKKVKYQEKSRELIAVKTQFNLKHSLKLLDAEACYLLTLEIGIPIELIAIKCNIGVLSIDVDPSFGIKTQHKLMVNNIKQTQIASNMNNNMSNINNNNLINHDSSNCLSTPLLMLLDDSETMSNNCFVFHCESANVSDNGKGKKLDNGKTKQMGTINKNKIRNSNDTTRFTWKFRVLEGMQGEMVAYVASNQIPKTCQSVVLPIQSLSLHSNVFEIDEKEIFDQRPSNTLILKGEFTIRAFNNWLQQCVPEVSERVQINPTASNNANNVTYNWISTYVESYLTVTFNSGNAMFKSDNISVIAILQKYLTKYAIENNVTMTNVEIKCDIQSIIHFMNNLISNKLNRHKKIFEQNQLISCLKEIASHETDLGPDGSLMNYLNDEYRYILNNSEKIEKLFEMAPKHLDFIKKTIWFAIEHYNKPRNINLNNNQKLQLIKAIDSCDTQNIINEIKTFMR